MFSALLRTMTFEALLAVLSEEASWIRLLWFRNGCDRKVDSFELRWELPADCNLKITATLANRLRHKYHSLENFPAEKTLLCLKILDK